MASEPLYKPVDNPINSVAVDDAEAHHSSVGGGGPGSGSYEGYENSLSKDKMSLNAFLGQVEDGSSVGHVAINLSNAIVGAGIIGLPYTLHLSGFWLGLIIFGVMGVVTNYSLNCLVRAGIVVRERSFEALAYKTLGPRGCMVVLASQLAFDYGAALSYLVITGDTATEVLRHFLGHSFHGMRQLCIFVLSVGFMLPLSLMRDISGLESFSSASVGTVCVVAAIVIVKLIISRSEGEDGPMLDFSSGDAWGVVQSVGIFSFAFVCQDCVFFYYTSLHNGTPERFFQVSTVALFGAGVLSATLGVAGFLTFGDDTEDNLLNNYSGADQAAIIMRVLYTLTMLLTYPITIFVCREVLHALLGFGWGGKGRLQGDVRNVSRTRHLTYSCLLFFSTVAITMVVENLGVVMSITGNVAGSCLGFILPGLIMFTPEVRSELATGNVWRDTVGPAGLVAFGTIAAILGILTEIL